MNEESARLIDDGSGDLALRKGVAALLRAGLAERDSLDELLLLLLPLLLPGGDPPLRNDVRRLRGEPGK